MWSAFSVLSLFRPYRPITIGGRRWRSRFISAGSTGFIFFAALHVAGALFHGVVRRDGVIERMLPLRGFR